MSYIKEGTKRGLLGILSALFLSYTVLVLSTLNADIITFDTGVLSQQYLMYGLSGFYFAFISIIFSIEEWSILKQLTTHIVSTLPFLPIAYVSGMMPDSAFGITSFVGIYLSSYLVSFIIYKMHLKKQMKLINESL